MYIKQFGLPPSTPTHPERDGLCPKLTNSEQSNTNQFPHIHCPKRPRPSRECIRQSELFKLIYGWLFDWGMRPLSNHINTTPFHSHSGFSLWELENVSIPAVAASTPLLFFLSISFFTSMVRAKRLSVWIYSNQRQFLHCIVWFQRPENTTWTPLDHGFHALSCTRRRLENENY